MSKRAIFNSETVSVPKRCGDNDTTPQTSLWSCAAVMTPAPPKECPSKTIELDPIPFKNEQPASISIMHSEKSFGFLYLRRKTLLFDFLSNVDSRVYKPSTGPSNPPFAPLHKSLH